MTPMAPTRPTHPNPILPTPRESHVRLVVSLAAAATARAEVEAAIRAWRLPVDTDTAILLTSELVSNAVTHGDAEPSGYVILGISCDTTGLRVEVHDGSASLPVLEDVPAEAETGRGLLLVASLSAEWGFYRTPAGKAVYFTLTFQPDVHAHVSMAPGTQGPTSVS